MEWTDCVVRRHRGTGTQLPTGVSYSSICGGRVLDWCYRGGMFVVHLRGTRRELLREFIIRLGYSTSIRLVVFGGTSVSIG